MTGDDTVTREDINRPERGRGDPRSADEENNEKDIRGTYSVGLKSFNKGTRSQ